MFYSHPCDLKGLDGNTIEIAGKLLKNEYLVFLAHKKSIQWILQKTLLDCLLRMDLRKLGDDAQDVDLVAGMPD